jgi:hypothetical protein
LVGVVNTMTTKPHQKRLKGMAKISDRRNRRPWGGDPIHRMFSAGTPKASAF